MSLYCRSKVSNHVNVENLFSQRNVLYCSRVLQKNIQQLQKNTSFFDQTSLVPPFYCFLFMKKIEKKPILPAFPFLKIIIFEVVLGYSRFVLYCFRVSAFYCVYFLEEGQKRNQQKTAPIFQNSIL